MAGHLRIKICGITSAADGRQAGLLGADAVGLNFFEESPRRVDHQTARSIIRELPAFVDPVGVFVHSELNHVLALARQIPGIKTIQWHGPDKEWCNPDPYRLVPAFSIQDESSLQEITRFLDRGRALGLTVAAILVDAQVAGKFGGTGRQAPWRLLADFRPGVPLILAGGLTPDNVGQAVAMVQPYGVDVASGVETSPGQKDAEKLRRFLDRAREAQAKLDS
jgi:phosphoribosylanthranilate isomerase